MREGKFADGEKVLRAKIELQLLLTLPGAWLCAGCAMAALRIPAGQGLLVMVVLAAFAWLTAQFGLVLGLCLPNLHWVSEAAVVKRSAASMLAMFGGWLLAGGVLFLPMSLLDYAVPPLAAQAVCLAVLLGLSACTLRYVHSALEEYEASQPEKILAGRIECLCKPGA